MDIFIGVRLPNPYGREDLAPTRSPTSCFYQTHVKYIHGRHTDSINPDISHTGLEPNNNQ